MSVPKLQIGGLNKSFGKGAKRVQALIPGLSRQACPAMSNPPHWPYQFVMTAILTPIQFQFTPLPTMLYYDWEGAGTLVGVMNEARTLPPRLDEPIRSTGRLGTHPPRDRIAHPGH